jgi:hypothetical protein
MHDAERDGFHSQERWGRERRSLGSKGEEEFTVPITIMRHTPLNCCSSFSSSIRPGREV